MRAACFLVVLAVAVPASAQEAVQAKADTTATTETKYKGDSDTLPGALVLGGKIGAIFPQPFTELGTHVAVGIEAGYRLPWVGQRIEIMGDVGYSPPHHSFTVTRPEGDYQGVIDQEELHFSLGPRVRFMDRSSPWNVYVAAGGRLFLLKTLSNGSRNGNDFAQFTEQSTQIGFFAALGGEYVLGPGALFIDADLGWSKLPHVITGDVSTGNITATLGYRFFLL